MVATSGRGRSSAIFSEVKTTYEKWLSVALRHEVGELLTDAILGIFGVLVSVLVGVTGNPPWK